MEQRKYTFKDIEGNEGAVYDNQYIELVTNCNQYYIAINNRIDYEITKDTYEQLMNDMRK